MSGYLPAICQQRSVSAGLVEYLLGPEFLPWMSLVYNVIVLPLSVFN
jgi:hypothetical protein